MKSLLASKIIPASAGEHFGLRYAVHVLHFGVAEGCRRITIMRTLPRIVVAVSLLAMAGCTGETSTPSGRVVSAIREVGAAPLRRDAEAVAARVTTRDSSGPTKIPEALWTDSIRKFKPEYIYLGSDHLTIVTSRSGRYENGIVVYFPAHPDDSLAPGAFAGGGSGRGDYKMAAGIYWFWQKIRSSAALRHRLQEMEKGSNGSPGRSMQRTVAHRLAQSLIHPQWRLTPAVDAQRVPQP